VQGHERKVTTQTGFYGKKRGGWTQNTWVGKKDNFLVEIGSDEGIIEKGL